MTIEQIYKLALDKAIKADLRGEGVIKKKLKKTKEKYEKLDKDPPNGEAGKKAEFDKESLVNPYADSRMFVKDPKKKVKKVLTGIDIDTGEVMLAKELGVDLIIGHHPMGSALAALGEVMDMQVEMLAKEGVPINVAQNLMKMRMSEVSRSVGAANHWQAIDAAKALGIDVMCTHTFADNLVARYVTDAIAKKKPETVGEIIKLLKEIPEYKEANLQKAGPKIFVGAEDNYCGKVIVSEMTGGTSGSKDIYEKLAQAGIGTVVGMHMSEEWKKQAEKNHINVVIAGHMASDSVGMNLMLDEIEKKGVEVIPCSGLIRVKRFKAKK